jgi:exonuclease VII large subunit
MLFLGKNLKYFFESLIKIKFSELNRVNSLLNNLNIDNILKRGFVLLKNNKNELIKSSKNLKKNKNINIYFHNEVVNTDINIKK